MQAWRDSLAAVGLTLNWSKLHVWNPHQLDLPIDFQTEFPEARYAMDGFRVCGLPLDQADPQDPHDFSPLGTGDEFTTAFLAEARHALQQRLRTLSTFVHTVGHMRKATTSRSRSPGSTCRIDMCICFGSVIPPRCAPGRPTWPGTPRHGSASC